MPTTLIVSDDLSGAADSAVAFAAQGECMVGFDAGDCDSQTLAIDADSRSMTEADASAVTEHLFAAHAREGMTFIKKIDSTLRGHVGAEIAGAQRGLAAIDPFVAFCPAFPAVGRRVKGGRVYVNGTPLEQTAIGRNVAESGDLAKILSRAGVRNAGIFDAETDDDLAQLVQSLKQSGRPILWVGSGGLARALAGFGPTTAPAVTPVDGPVLFLVGSASTVSHAQITHLSDIAELTPVAPERALEGGLTLAPLRSNRVVYLQGPLLAEAQGLPQALAAAVAPLAAQAEALVITGGETARALLQRLGMRALRILGEIEPGVVLSRAVGGVLEGRMIVTKAGAFGSPDTLRRVQAVIQGPARSMATGTQSSTGTHGS